MLPGLLCAASLIALSRTHGQTRLYAAAAGVLAVALALRAAVRRGPLSVPADIAPGRPPAPGPGGSSGTPCWATACCAPPSPAAPTASPDGTAEGHWPLALAPVLALTLACLPATWTTHLFLTVARRKLATSRALEDFAASVRPVLLGTVALFLGALAAIVALCSPFLGTAPASATILTLGALLLVARLLTVHGFTHAPRVILMLTAVGQVLALATVFAARLPGCALLGAPVETPGDRLGSRRRPRPHLWCGRPGPAGPRLPHPHPRLGAPARGAAAMTPAVAGRRGPTRPRAPAGRPSRTPRPTGSRTHRRRARPHPKEIPA